MTTIDHFKGLTPLLRAFRNAQGPTSTVALECFLLCAEQPRTIAELEAATGLNNGAINRALRTLTPYYDAKTETVVRPAMHLLQRRRQLVGRGHRYHLTSKGRALLKAQDPVTDPQNTTGLQYPPGADL